ncbi:MAG TPA: NADH-quinone oxidoreductase subunit F [Dehalococcoidia bacterium]|nr:NADH-quinone oxidoreductase subunit F [Dehalococcoidia bacterium]
MPEQRVVLKNCGIIDPGQIATYLAADGFKALKKARDVGQEQVIQTIKDSGLRGRGGAGFPCGVKWEMAKDAPGDNKYVICNADEGEVGTFKDRHILSNDPFSLIEGMAIACYAIGARKGYIYLRAEYHYLYDRLLESINQVCEAGFLDGLNIDVYEGAGAYVCGEESALMDSIEGKRGEVRYRPPFPPTKGLWGKPTIINNVETLMNIPWIILHGAEWFCEIGTERSKGTKVFSVSGDVTKPGVYEMVLGSQLRELVEGLAGARAVKAIQVGGATGRIVPHDMMDTPLTFETLLGAGAITVFDETRDIVDIVRQTLEFLAEESCGKCSPCREGTEVMVGILGRFTRGEGSAHDIAAMERLSQAMMLSALCGLGQAAPNPVLDSLQYFRGEYDSRVKG